MYIIVTLYYKVDNDLLPERNRTENNVVNVLTSHAFQCFRMEIFRTCFE